ncbi:hypothetical protein ACIBAG_04430 [Streptomyces sp. NPDC051243]|uniref:hypothetical protein n=1 Tax=Streptomyces sp. NPDC051243 TaxID=3365646 RepID=UPI00379A1B41
MANWPLFVGSSGGGGMRRRAKGWLFGGWLVLVVAGWSFTESINDGIEPTSGPRPKSSPDRASDCSVATPTPAPSPTPMPTWPARADGYGLADQYGEANAGVVVTLVACKTVD